MQGLNSDQEHRMDRYRAARLAVTVYETAQEQVEPGVLDWDNFSLEATFRTLLRGTE